MQSLEDGAGAWQGALIAITAGGEATIRPAAFVFDAPGGLAWVEPAYRDPAGASMQALHVRKGQRTAWNVLSGDGWRLEVLPYTADDSDLVGDALQWFGEVLRAEGRTWEEERERVRQVIAEVLA